MERNTSRWLFHLAYWGFVLGGYGLLAYGSSFDQIGVLSHSVSDAALLLEAMAAGRAVVASPGALEGIDAEVGTHVLCAAHGALFRISDGACEIGPCLGRSLTRLETQIRDGIVFLAQDNTDRGPSPARRY